MEINNNFIDGYVLKIVVKNFFCHDNFAIEFKTNVNYVVGNNGSGKSALVTALVVGFGGKAAATSRGTSLSSFIKNGAETASVAITIKNTGPTAYKHDIYGDSITVIHDFTVSGGSKYKVKSHAGKVESTKFQDVNDIALHHNIQVENPICILNQDEARIFHKESPKEKYLFFKRATNLDKTEKYYKEALVFCKKAEDKWECKNISAKSLEEEYMKWNKLHEAMLSRQGLEEEKKALENEYYWGEVAELEQAVEEARGKQQRRDGDVERLQGKRDRLASAASSNLRAERDKLAVAEAQREAAKQRWQAAQQALREGEAAADRRERAARALSEKAEREQRKLRDLQEGIRNLQTGAGEAVRAELEERVAAGEAACEAARARLATAEETTAQARQNAARARDASDEAQEQLQRLQRKTEEVRGELRGLQRAGSDALAVYGHEMAELRRRLDDAAKRGAFSAPPRGPVGSYITLRDKQWGSAVEHILGASLTTFCADNDKDARTLNTIINEVYRGSRSRRPGVSYSRFRAQAHDVSRSTARAAGLLSALDAVRVEDPVVVNFLIDNLALESVLLAPDDQAAMQVTTERASVPAHLRRVVTRGCAEFYPAPNYRTYGGRQRRVTYLQQDIDNRLRQVKADVEACVAAERAGAARAEAAAAGRRVADDVRRDEERALAALRAAAAAAATQLDEAREALRQHQPPTYQALEEEMRVSEDRLKSIRDQQRAAGEGGEDLKALGQEAKAAVVAMQQFKEHCRTLQERVQEEQLRMDNALSRSAVLEQRLGLLVNEQERARAALEADAAALEAKRQKALKLCERIDNPRSTSMVRRLVTQAAARLREGLGTTLSRAAVGERLSDVKKKHNHVQRSLARCRRLIDQLQHVVEQHQAVCYNMQKQIVRNVQCSFKSTLELRAFTGSLEVDMGRGLLHVTGAPSGKAAGDTAIMSGGERSYTTVAFLMALWDCIDLPFVFLDEFDVFMDPVNRTVVLNLLKTHARRHGGRQFVFLTPQNGTTMEDDEQREGFVEIFRLTK